MKACHQKMTSLQWWSLVLYNLFERWLECCKTAEVAGVEVWKMVDWIAGLHSNRTGHRAVVHWWLLPNLFIFSTVLFGLSFFSTAFFTGWLMSDEWQLVCSCAVCWWCDLLILDARLAVHSVFLSVTITSMMKMIRMVVTHPVVMITSLFLLSLLLYAQ